MNMKEVYKLHVLLGILVSLTYAEETVRYAAVIFRHGQRTPVDPYPTDPWRNESLWPVRFGELTNEGKRQHYALGQWFRKRYNHLLSPEFDPKEIYVRSTDVDRTLMSAQANLAGLYPPTGKTIWNDHIMWQPIPIHTVPQKLDEVLAMEKPCPAYNKSYEQLVNSQEYKEGLSKYQKLMNYLTAYTGKRVTNYNEIEYIYSNLFIETLFNFTLPNWTHSYYPEKLKTPAGHSFAVSTLNAKLARLKVGPLLQEIIHNVHKAVPTNSTALKFSMYSGHDITIGSVLNALGIYDGNCPVFTATIIFELIYNNETDTNYITISYRNSTDIVEPTVIYIPYCGQRCPIKRFVKIYDKLLNFNWDQECNESQDPIRFSLFMSITFFMGLSILITIFMARKIYFSRRQIISSFPYSSVENLTQKSDEA